MSKNSIYRMLETPWIYRLSQAILAPGAEKGIVRSINTVLSRAPSANRILDVGCGPVSWLWRAGLNPIGVDSSVKYVSKFNGRGGKAIAGTTGDLPFFDGCFDAVWCFFTLHHMPNDAAREAVREMTRICRAGGYVAICDAIMPTAGFHKPLPWLLRCLDRGGHVRSGQDMESLLGDLNGWSCEKVTYSWLGYEALFCLYRKN